MFQITTTKNEIIQIYEPPVDVSVNADIVVDVQYAVGNQETYDLMANSIPENAIADTVSLGVLKGLNSSFPSGLSFKQVENPPAEIGNAALEIIKDELLKFFGIVFTGIVVREIKAEIPSFISDVLNHQIPVNTNPVKTNSANTKSAVQWVCPDCANKNEGKFCTECGATKPMDDNWICPNCQTVNIKKFCSECGTKRP